MRRYNTEPVHAQDETGRCTPSKDTTAFEAGKNNKLVSDTNRNKLNLDPREEYVPHGQVSERSSNLSPRRFYLPHDHRDPKLFRLIQHPNICQKTTTPQSRGVARQNRD